MRALRGLSHGSGAAKRMVSAAMLRGRRASGVSFAVSVASCTVQDPVIENQPLPQCEGEFAAIYARSTFSSAVKVWLC